MKKINLILLIALAVFSLGCTTSQPPSTPAYTPTATQTTAASSPAVTPAYDIRFDNFTAHTDGKVRFRAFGKSSYSLSDLKWFINLDELKDYSKIIVGYQEDIGTTNTMIRGAPEGEPIYIKTGQSWMTGTPVSIKIMEKQSGIVLVDKILIVQQ